MEGHHAPCTMNIEPPATSPTASARYQMSQQSERMPRQQTSQVTRERRKSHHSWTHSPPAWALNDKLSTLQLAWLSILGTLTKFRGIVSKENTGNLNKIFLSSSLHGFPSHVHPRIHLLWLHGWKKCC